MLPHRIDRFEIDQQGIHDATHFDQLSPLATVADEARHFTTDRRSSRARRVPLDPQAVEAIRYSTDPVNRRLVTRADGVVTFDEINAHLDDEQRNRDLDRPELIDARGATTDLTTEQVRELVRRAADMLRLVELGPTTIVTADDVLYGMARMYSTLAEGVGAVSEVFRDVESATRWLNRVSAERD